MRRKRRCAMNINGPGVSAVPVSPAINSGRERQRSPPHSLCPDSRISSVSLRRMRAPLRDLCSCSIPTCICAWPFKSGLSGLYKFGGKGIMWWCSIAWFRLEFTTPPLSWPWIDCSDILKPPSLLCSKCFTASDACDWLSVNTQHIGNCCL